MLPSNDLQNFNNLKISLASAVQNKDGRRQKKYEYNGSMAS